VVHPLSTPLRQKIKKTDEVATLRKVFGTTLLKKVQ